MGGGAISFSFHRRCGIYVLLIHSDIFLCVQRSEYADSFFEQDRGSGAMADTRFGRKILPGALGAEVWRFSLPTAGTDLGVAQAPSYLCEGKETASVAYASSGAFWLAESRTELVRAMPKRKNEDGVNVWMKKQKCKGYKSKIKRWLAPGSQPPI